MSKPANTGAHTCAPVLVGPANCVAVLGVPWRRARDAGRRAGLTPVRIGKAGCYRVAELLAALEADAAPDTTEDPRGAVLRALGRAC